MNDVTYPLAFLAGVLSFLSPCVLPLVPSYVTYITGVSFEELTSEVDRKRVRFLTATNSIAFILGFSVIFIAMGASSSFLGQLIQQYLDWLRIIGGILIIVFGLFISGLINLNFLMREKKFQLQGRPAGYLGSFAIGVVFVAGWTPCIGPILAAILLVAASHGSTFYGVKLLAVYSLGLAVPFFLSAYAINSFLSYSKSIYKYMKTIKIISGLVLITFGILLLLDKVSALSTYFPDLGINF